MHSESKSHRIFINKLTMAHQSATLMDTFKNDNEAFEALTIHFLQEKVDSFHQLQLLLNEGVIVSIFRQCLP